MSLLLLRARASQGNLRVKTLAGCGRKAHVKVNMKEKLSKCEFTGESDFFESDFFFHEFTGGCCQSCQLSHLFFDLKKLSYRVSVLRMEFWQAVFLIFKALLLLVFFHYLWKSYTQCLLGISAVKSFLRDTDLGHLTFSWSFSKEVC